MPGLRLGPVQAIQPSPMGERERRWREGIAREMGIPVRLVNKFLEGHDRWSLHQGFQAGRRLHEIP